MTAQLRELARYATLAANAHNTQPWKFAIQESSIEIHPDYTRSLPVVDPDHRELWISLGCALENLLVAAHAAGYECDAVYPDAKDLILIKLTADSPRPSPLFDAIPDRQNTRSTYSGQPIRSDQLDQIQAVPMEPGVTLRMVADRSGLETILEYVDQADLTQFADRAYLSELIRWLRFNQKEAAASRDGLRTRCLGSPEVPRWLGRIFVSRTRPKKQADTDAKKLRSSAGAVVIASASDDRTSWVRTGQVYERLALTMTSLDVKSAFLNQPIEVADVRGQFQSAMELENNLPQLLVRFGYADPMPRSLRRPLEQVLM